MDRWWMWALPLGVLATAVMDVSGVVLHRWRGLPLPNYGMVGRWIGHMPRGRFLHASIAAAAPVRGEGVIGWTVHYAVGVAFAMLLLAVWGVEWLRSPTLMPPLLVGVLTVAAPFLLMQPAMGSGLASRRTPNPKAARLRSLLNHALFGFGLYGAGWLVRCVWFS